ncbi:MAG: hypothetical protein ACYC9Q_04335 [Bacillota bacterium]
MATVQPTPQAHTDAGVPKRCICNKLICIVRGDKIEIKCNKCKRLVTIYTKGIEKIDYHDPSA